MSRRRRLLTRLLPIVLIPLGTVAADAQTAPFVAAATFLRFFLAICNF